MLQALYDFFFTNVFYVAGNHWLSYGFNDLSTTSVLGVNLKLNQYLSVICTYISMVLILILCCLFVWKIIKLIGGLIR